MQNKLIPNEIYYNKVISKIKYILMILPVRYDEDDIPNDFPFRNGKQWTIKVDVHTGEIINFPKNIKINLNMKVTDEGIYKLLDENDEEIAMLYQEYVPDSYTIPGEYGDYIDFKIENGYIKNWYDEKKRTYVEFFE